ncbi:T9SS type B sorting domain-containing protein [Flavobacterium soyangense]|uniref:T9SS type B sorting domain-containing protein n=1 Tax=Flavobacterium soyangense TaxID=2023265 RepID=A0A930UCP4_9FLAO|nr:T9SS type B sorting domain-containing protein [Flavobacterium soyangense]MBF2708402.1 T9SS type B sorting domain-containing protein [Flavobacterium soyangense]
MKKILRSYAFLFLIITFSNSIVFAKSRINSYVSETLATAPPTVTSPIYLCQNSVAVPLTATPSVGGTLNWYTLAAGGVALAGAPTPITTSVGATTYYVTQTIAGVESNPRTPIVVNVVANTGGVLTPFCDFANTTPTSVAFDWNNVIGYLGYNYSYSIAGGPIVTGFQVSPSHFDVPVPGPGMSVTFNILSVLGLPCVLPTSTTCNSTCTAAQKIAPTFASIAPFCSGTIPIPLLPTLSNEGITGTWIPAIIDNTISKIYTFTPDPILFPCALTQTIPVTVDPLVTPAFSGIPAVVCQGATAPILPLSSNNVTPISGTWIPATVNTAITGTTVYTFTPNPSQCASATLTTVSIRIDPVLTPAFNPVAPICSGAVLAPLPTTSLNGVTGTWTPALNNTVTTTYTFAPTAGQCANSTTMTITVNPNVTPTFTPVPAICSGKVLAALPTISTNLITGTWAPALNNTATTTYTFTPTAGLCATKTTMIIIVNPNVTPTFNPVPAVCNGSVIAPLPTTSTNGIAGTWSPALNNTVTTLYTFTPTAGLCATTTTLTINVNPIVPPNFAPIPNVCSGSTAPILANRSPSGIVGTWSPATISNTIGRNYVFTPTAGQCSSTQTLTVVITPRVVTNFAAIPAFCSGTVAPILGPTSPNNVNGTWSPATINNTTSGSYLFTPNATECATTQTLNVVVNPLITPNFEDIPLCSGTAAPILPPTSPNGITGTWSPSTISNVASGAYVFTPNASQCATAKTINVTVNPSNTLTSISWSVTDAFSKNQIVTIIATAAGNYLYQLDNGPFQTSSVFENVASGIHSITVIDANGCSTPITDNNVLVIGYPKYFTPNGDNYNDFWNISALSNQLNTRIYIFDRFGKLLKDISPNDPGWDGTYIGQPMPADDYWFTVEYVEQSIVKKYKSHFSLKR